MPISVTSAAGGIGYIDVRLDPKGCETHQAIFDVSELGGVDDSDGYLPPGLPLQADGSPVDAGSQTAAYVVGPEAVKLGTADHFGNVILNGFLVRDAIEDNLGRVLSANELAALTAGGFKLIASA
jgi:hypothetical protein